VRRSGLTWLANLALAATSLGLGCVVVEAFAQYIESRPRPVARRLALMMENPAGTGSYRLRPNLDVTTHVQGQPSLLPCLARATRGGSAVC
jgi:hypothetical protein